MKKIIACILAVVLFTLWGCDKTYSYSGENKALSSATLAAVPGLLSSESDSFFVIEKDSFGRIFYGAYFVRSMFRSSSMNTFPSVFIVGIIQGIDDTHAYFYNEQNYLIAFPPDNFEGSDSDAVDEIFSREQIARLKIANDWNVPLEPNDDNCLKTPIRYEHNIALSGAAKKILDDTIGSDNRWESFFRKDDDGNMTYFVIKINGLHTESIEYAWYLVRFDNQWNIVNEETDIQRINDNLVNLAQQVNDFNNMIEE